MDVFLKAIESSQELSMDMDKLAAPARDSPSSLCDKTLSFDLRPPQWCIVDKWFTMRVVCHDDTIKEIEAIVYNREGEIIRDVECDRLIAKDKSKIVVAVESILKGDVPVKVATFRVRFTEGSKGTWLHIGFHASNKPDKCVLKSPPIKVQTNRSKRPRDSKKKPVPIVTSISPCTVPASGNFPSRTDRMVLVFGQHFYLWGNSPVIRLKVANGEDYVDIRPPDLIWWNENLLEFQLPPTRNDLKLSVANYDMVFGEFKPLSVIAESSNKMQVDSKAEMELQHITQRNFVFDRGVMNEGIYQEVKLLLFIKDERTQVLVATAAETSSAIDVSDLAIQAKIIDKSNPTVAPLHEFYTPSEPGKLVRYFDHLVLQIQIPSTAIQKIKQMADNEKENLVVVASLVKKSSSQPVVDPISRAPILAEKQLLVSEEEDDDEPLYDDNVKHMAIENPEKAQVPLPVPVHTSASALVMSGLALKASSMYPKSDLATLRFSLSNFISQCAQPEVLLELQYVLQQCTERLVHRKLELETSLRGELSRTNSIGNHLPVVVTTPVPPAPEKPEKADGVNRPLHEITGELEEKAIPVPQVLQLDKNGATSKHIVHWKFFNPGTRTFLELTLGKLQIIGSRRIQMLIESVPRGSKYESSRLFVQNGEHFESIDNCARCKENGIPNVFCVLPKRGREYDHPWVTFRITCTSTAKHWKGSPFWIGADFISESGKKFQVFSPPIYVQSKVKTKDLERTTSSPPQTSALFALSPENSNEEFKNLLNQSSQSHEDTSSQKEEVPEANGSRTDPRVPNPAWLSKIEEHFLPKNQPSVKKEEVQ